MTSKLTRGLLLGTALALSTAADAQAQSMFFFTGTLLDGSQAQATLTLVGGAGANLTPGDFVSFSYTSATLGTVVVAAVDDLSGSLTNLPRPADVLFDMHDTGLRFVSSAATGFWQFSTGSAQDAGLSHIWDVTPPPPPPPPATVPEPAAWGLMVAGFALTGAALRLRRRPVVRFA